MRRGTRCPVAGSSISRSIGVSITPGATAFTRTPSGAHSTASCFVRATTPALLAL